MKWEVGRVPEAELECANMLLRWDGIWLKQHGTGDDAWSFLDTLASPELTKLRITSLRNILSRNIPREILSSVGFIHLGIESCCRPLKWPNQAKHYQFVEVGGRCQVPQLTKEGRKPDAVWPKLQIFHPSLLSPYTTDTFQTWELQRKISKQWLAVLMRFVERNYKNNSQQKILVEKNIMLPHSCARILFHFMYISIFQSVLFEVLPWCCCDHVVTMHCGNLPTQWLLVTKNTANYKNSFAHECVCGQNQLRPSQVDICKSFTLTIHLVLANCPTQTWTNLETILWCCFPKDGTLINSGVVWDSKLTFVNVNTLTIHQVSNSNLNSLNPTSWVRFWNKPHNLHHIFKHPFDFYI